MVGWEFIMANHAQMVDTWSYHHNSIIGIPGFCTATLMNILPIFSMILTTEVFQNFFASTNSYWNDLKGNFFIKILSIFNIFSFGNYYINVIFYSFISMFGPVAIYRVMNDVFPGKKLQVLIAVFLIPSFLYWTSGLHKEGLLFLGFSLIIFNIYFGLKRKKISLANIIFILLGLTLVVALRNFLIVILAPALIAWLLSQKFNKKPLIVFGICYLAFVIFFFMAGYINTNFDFPKAVVTKQREFVALVGNSSVPMKKLEPTFYSFIKNIPQAISLSMLRPYLSDVTHILSLAAAAETDILLFIVFTFLFWKRKTKLSPHSLIFIYFSAFLSFSILITIGYVVNNLGAIVRYRSIVLPLLFTPIICGIDWKRVNNVLFPNIKK